MISGRSSILHHFGRWLLAGCLLMAGAQLAAAQQPPKNFVLHEAPKPIAAIGFEDGQGRARSLAEFRGKVVLLNIWATWCSPCRREMPALDRLQTALGGADFEVVALSIDRAGIEAVRKFYAEVGVTKLAMYIDGAGKAVHELSAVGLPTTLLIDREGRELGRLAGPAEWDAPEVVEFLKAIVSRPRASAEPITDSSMPSLATGECSDRTIQGLCPHVTADPKPRSTTRGVAL
jgi:thiol-disulfide isomerase/thioredoxin